MRRSIYFLILSIISILSCFADTTITLYTKCGQSIQAYIRDELNASTITNLNSYYTTVFSEATCIGGSTQRYNSHSYTWYLSDGGNTNYWINDSTYDSMGNSIGPNIEKYWTNDYYVPASSSDATKIHYYNSDHSAIISTTVSGMYESKWGQGPLMRHAPGYGPYEHMNERHYYKPVYVHGLLLCSNGTGTIGVNVSANYGPLSSSVPNIAVTYEWAIEDSKEGDAIEEGYAVFNSQSGYNANIKFTRPGSYDMTLRCYSQNHTLVADYSFQAYVI